MAFERLRTVLAGKNVKPPEYVTPMIDGRPTVDFVNMDDDLDVMLRCCEAETLAHQKTNQPPEPHFFSSSIVLAEEEGDYDLIAAICTAYFEMYEKSKEYRKQCKKAGVKYLKLPEFKDSHMLLKINLLRLPSFKLKQQELDFDVKDTQTETEELTTEIQREKTFKTKVAGVSQGRRQAKLRKYSRMEDSLDWPPITLEREPSNKHDPNAIKVLLEEDYYYVKNHPKFYHIGYIRTNVAASLAKEMDRGRKVTALFDDILGGFDVDEEGEFYGMLISITIEK